MQTPDCSRGTVAALALVTVACPAFAGPIDVTVTTPTGDRWNYPFNPTPGLRASASVFGNDAGSPLFDNRDGQMVLHWDLGSLVPAGLGASSYEITSVRVTLEFSSDLAIAYDPTTDPWQAFVAEDDPSYVADEDDGQPIELFGTGFRNGFDASTWVETTPYTAGGMDPLSPGVRTAYALGSDGEGSLVDVSNNVRDMFTPTPFATGEIDGLTPGEYIPVGTAMTFDLDVSDPLVQEYLAGSLDAGQLMLSVTSLARVVEQGSIFPAFYCKESPLVVDGFASAATLELSVVTSECGPLGDLNCDGAVSAEDLAILLGAWGTDDPNADLDGNGSVGQADLAILLGSWTK